VTKITGRAYMKNEKDENEIRDNPKLSILAIISFILAVLSPFTFMLTAIPALVLGITSLLEMRKSSTRLKGKSFAIIGIALPSMVIILVMLSVMARWTGNLMFEIARNRKNVQNTNLSGISKAMEIYGSGTTQSPIHDTRMARGTNIIVLAKAFQIYFNDHDEYPASEKWCDLLIENCNVERKTFRCPTAKEGPCNYALNKYISEMGNTSQTDIVVLFEAKPGWNQVGGPEILTTENHKGEGCNVVFLDSHVEFIKAVDISKLKWKPD
jgi:prepilin-type processing-associated H-X9-DG protein